MSDRNLEKNMTTSFGHYVAKKGEKIVSAVYLVTSLFPENEPLRIKLRQIAMDLLAEVNSIGQIVYGNSPSASLNIGATVSNILSYFSIARNANLVSEMNYSVLEKELVSLVDITGGSLGGRSDIRFGGTFFGVEAPLLGESMLKSSHNRDNQVGAVKIDGVKSISKDVIKIKQKSYSQNRRESEKTIKAKRARREQILQILKDKNKASIKDISHAVGGYSEKTIQRELIKLVKSGLIKRLGTRRWSTYSLT